MQRLEVSGAVRPLLGSLGFKGLTLVNSPTKSSSEVQTCYNPMDVGPHYTGFIEEVQIPAT